MDKKILILGGGFGGIRVALDLEKRLPDADIVIVNNSPSHSYHADLYKIAAVKLEREREVDFKNLSGTVNIPLKKIFQDKNVEVLVSKVLEIDLEKREVKIVSKSLSYDFLVLALGSKTNYFDISGAEDFSHPLKNTEDAINIRNDLDELITREKERLTVVVSGGGFTGAEVSGELRGYLPKRVNLILLEATESVLSGMPKWASEMAIERLKKMGVDVRLNHGVKKVEERKIFCQGGEEVLYDYLIWTAGIFGENLEGKIKGVEFSKKRQIEVEKDLSVPNFAEVFVVGDLVDFKKGDKKIPETAWMAISEGKWVGKNIIKKIKEEETLAYDPPGPVFVVPVGKRFALVSIGFLETYGFIAWVIKKLVTLKYLISILPIGKAIKIWWKGVKIYTQDV